MKVSFTVRFSGCDPVSKPNWGLAKRVPFGEEERRDEQVSAVGWNERYEVCSHDAPLAQLVEQLTLNQWVPGSNP